MRSRSQPLVFLLAAPADDRTWRFMDALAEATAAHLQRVPRVVRVFAQREPSGGRCFVHVLSEWNVRENLVEPDDPNDLAELSVHLEHAIEAEVWSNERSFRVGHCLPCRR